MFERTIKVLEQENSSAYEKIRRLETNEEKNGKSRMITIKKVYRKVKKIIKN